MGDRADKDFEECEGTRIALKDFISYIKTQFKLAYQVGSEKRKVWIDDKLKSEPKESSDKTDIPKEM